MMDKPILMTATITPRSDVLGLVRVDPVVRLNDYLEALEYYLSLPVDLLRRIVFVENSLSDLSKLRALADRYPGKEVEFVSFYGLDYPAEHGRGYGEFKLLDHAVDNSKLLANLGPEDQVWKATGRLRLLNIDKMFRSAPERYDVYCDLRDKPIPWMELRFFSFSMSGYERHFKGIYRKLCETQEAEAGEKTMRKLVQSKLGDPLFVPRFRTQPWIEGVQGSFNTNYAHGYKNRAKYAYRALMRKVAPKYWV